jgi:hypothetical protein
MLNILKLIVAGYVKCNNDIDEFGSGSVTQVTLSLSELHYPLIWFRTLLVPAFLSENVFLLSNMKMLFLCKRM